MAYKYDTLVRQYRENLGFTQEEAAERAGVSFRTYCNIERYACGTVKNKPSLGSMECVAKLFGISPGALCDMLYKEGR